MDSINCLVVDGYLIQENGIVRDNETGKLLFRLRELVEESQEAKKDTELRIQSAIRQTAEELLAYVKEQGYVMPEDEEAIRAKYLK